MKNPVNAAVFASGGGSNFQALLDKQLEGFLHIEFGVVVGNNSNAKVFDRAKKQGIPCVHTTQAHFADEESYSAYLMQILNTYSIDIILCAGYMKMLPAAIVRTFHNRIMNIHPALLPAFGGKGMYGSRVHQAVLDYGAKISGITVHFVDTEYDHGPVILQKTLDVLDIDTAESLAERVLELEHAWYWQVIEAVVQGRITVDGRKVKGMIA